MSIIYCRENTKCWFPCVLCLQSFPNIKEEDDLSDEDLKAAVDQENEVKKEPSVTDIEDVIPPELEQLDKKKGFVKYKRATNQYRAPKERLEDWGEVYNHKGVMQGLRKQAARCMDCGVPFCQSDHGCPLGNIIPKWNDLVFRVSAASYILQININTSHRVGWNFLMINCFVEWEVQ